MPLSRNHAGPAAQLTVKALGGRISVSVSARFHEAPRRCTRNAFLTGPRGLCAWSKLRWDGRRQWREKAWRCAPAASVAAQCHVSACTFTWRTSDCCAARPRLGGRIPGVSKCLRQSSAAEHEAANDRIVKRRSLLITSAASLGGTRLRDIVCNVTSRAKLLAKILSGRADQNVLFDELVALLRHLDFQVRVAGSHHIFSREDVAEILNLQPRRDGTAKPYQVKQVRHVLTRYRLIGDENAI